MNFEIISKAADKLKCYGDDYHLELIKMMKDNHGVIASELNEGMINYNKLNRNVLKYVGEKCLEFSSPRITDPGDIISVCRQLVFRRDREHMFCLLLNSSHKVVDVDVVSIGIENKCIVKPNLLLKKAIMNDCLAVAICHNHPSGEVNPSPEDLEVTKRISAAGELMGINVLDHVIIGWKGNFFDYYSMQENRDM